LKKIIQNTLALLQSNERKQLIVLAFFNVCISILDIVAIAILLAVVNLYTGQESKIQHVLPHWLSDKNTLLPIILFLLFFIGKNIAGFSVFQAQLKFVYRVAARISSMQLPRYLKSSFHDYVTIDSSIMNRRIQHQPIEFGHYVLSSLQQILSELVLASLAIIAILLFDAQLFLLLITFLLPPVFIVAYFSKKKLKNARIHVKSDAEKTTQYLKEALDSYVEANVYGKIMFFTKRYSSYQNKLNSHLSQLQIAQGMPARLMEIFAVIGLFILIIMQQLHGHSSDVISLGAFIAAAYKIIPSIVRIANLSTLVRTYAHTIEDLSYTEISAAQEPIDTTQINSIRFQNVNFAHQDKNILQSVNFALSLGDFVSISGASGKGKTTLINILLGFLSPNSGVVLFNEQATTSAQRINVQRQISYVKQQNFLIHDTILRNITLEEDHHNQVLLDRAIALSGLDNFISSFAEGVEKIITDSGKNVSGGQRQRIAIARALYKDAPIIILDEPFNELDKTSEIILLKNFKKLSEEGKLIVLISHSTLSSDYCNKTIMVNE
jgi:ABC-type multidrug transport system fused ATPase/permease subunit